MGGTQRVLVPAYQDWRHARKANVRRISLSCVRVYSPSHVKTTDPLTNNLFSKDHIADQVQPCGRILIEVQAVLSTIVGPCKVPTHCI